MLADNQNGWTDGFMWQLHRAGACNPSLSLPLRSPATDPDGKAAATVFRPISAGIPRLPKLQLPLTITTEALAQPRQLDLSSSLPLLLLLERLAPCMLLRKPAEC